MATCTDISSHPGIGSQSSVLTCAAGCVSMAGIKRGHGPGRSCRSAGGITPARGQQYKYAEAIEAARVAALRTDARGNCHFTAEAMTA